MLSLEVTDLVGRKAEIAEVGGFLARARMVTIAGPGGVGKTRVAARVARRSAARYAAGTRFVELSGLSDPDLLPNTVAASLGLRWQGSLGPLEAVLDYLRERQVLLVLDTCEHLIDACALFAEAVLMDAPDTSILATSRQPLNVAGEHLYHLAPLPAPDAARLFARRAADANPAFTATAADADDIARVCRRLDGIPLAIELAAVRLRALSLGDLAGRLDDRFDALGTRRGGAPRHQTMRTAIEWSHDLCTEAERALWARLSVFAGGFDLAAAERVCAGHGLAGAEIAEALFGLVDKSVALRDAGRYRLLDTIREFGAERLAESGRERLYRGRHVGHCLGLARDFQEHFVDHDQAARLGTLRPEHDNLRTAMRYALASDNDRLAADGAALASELHGYWTIAGLPREGRHWLDQALSRLPAGPSAERARALMVRGYLGTYGGEPEDAVAETTAGADMARALGDDRLLARARVYQVLALIFSGRLDEAVEVSREARRRVGETGDRLGLMLLEAETGHLHELRGDLREAIDSCLRCLDVLREIGGVDPATGEITELWAQSYCHMMIGLALHFMGEQAEAARSFSRALPMSHARDDAIGCGYALEGLGWIAASERRWNRAAWLLGAADTLWNQAGARLGSNLLLEEIHHQMIDETRRELPAGRFDTLFRQGAGYPLARMIEPAVGDADALGRPDQAPAQATEPPRGRLTAREREIAGLVALGLSNREIASKLVISVRTVDSHVDHVYTKLGLSSRVQLTIWVQEEDAGWSRDGNHDPFGRLMV